jgi:hypothetical protein
MQNRRLSTNTLLLVTSLALAHCGGDNSGTGVTPESGAPDGTRQDASPDTGDAVSDRTTPDYDADAFSEAGADATDAGDGGGDSGDATMDGQDVGADAWDASPDASSDSADGATADAADTGPVRLACGSQVCNAGEFCATPPVPAGDAGDGGDATASDGSSEAAVETDGAPEGAAADGGSPDADSSSSAAADGNGARCESATFANLCHNPSATVFLDQYPPDNQSALMMANALQNACRITIISPATDDAGAVADPNVIDPGSGQPKTGIGNLCLIGGGSYGQRAVGYLESHSLNNVVGVSGNNDAGVFSSYFIDRTVPSAPKTIAVEAPYSPTNNTHDYFVLQLSVDPASASVCLQAFGMTAQGTLAAGYYAAKHLIENGAYATSTKSWFVYEWTDEDDGGVPDDSDTYALVASGP